jgi:hypothetical protein
VSKVDKGRRQNTRRQYAVGTQGLSRKTTKSEGERVKEEAGESGER